MKEQKNCVWKVLILACLNSDVGYLTETLDFSMLSLSLWCIYRKKSDHLLLPWLSKTEVTGLRNAVFNFFWVPSYLYFWLPKDIILPGLIWSIYCFVKQRKKEKKNQTTKEEVENLIVFFSFPEVHCHWTTGQSYWYIRCYRKSNWRKALW